MKRLLSNVLAGVSLVLTIALIFTVAASYGLTGLGFYRAELQRTAPTYKYVLRFAFDGLFIERQELPLHRTMDPPNTWYGFSRYEPYPFRLSGATSQSEDFIGFRHAAYLMKSGSAGSDRVADIVIPYWFLVTLTMILPLLWFRRLPNRARRDGMSTVCGACGYDLRATPDRCPECGAVPRETA